MSFYIDCYWYGASLHGKDHAVMPVTIKRHRRRRLDAEWAEEIRPTRHFCVGETLDLDRLGLPEGAVGEAASCYLRAIAAIRGVDTTTPNLGLEWRLAEVTHTTSAAGDHDSPGSARTVDSEWARKLRDELAIVNGSGGIGHLTLDDQAFWALRRAGLFRIQEVQNATDAELLRLPRIGPKRLAEIRAAIDQTAADEAAA